MIPWTWFLNPKNAIIVILSLIIVAVSGAFLWERGSKAIIEAKADKLADDNQVLMQKIDGLAKNIEAIKKQQQKVKVIENNTETIREIIREVPKIEFGGNCNESDEQRKKEGEAIKNAARVVIDFFATGMLPEGYDPGQALLSATSKTNSDPPSNSERPSSSDTANSEVRSGTGIDR